MIVKEKNARSVFASTLLSPSYTLVALTVSTLTLPSPIGPSPVGHGARRALRPEGGFGPQGGMGEGNLGRESSCAMAELNLKFAAEVDDGSEGFME